MFTLALPEQRFLEPNVEEKVEGVEGEPWDHEDRHHAHQQVQSPGSQASVRGGKEHVK